VSHKNGATYFCNNFGKCGPVFNFSFTFVLEHEKLLVSVFAKSIAKIKVLIRLADREF